MPAGLLNQMWSTPELSDEEYFRSCIEDAQLAEALGYETLWFGEHHFGRHSALYPRIPNLEVLIATLARETSRLYLGTGIKQLASYAFDEIRGVDSSSGPPRLVEEMAMLDLATEGRARFGLGAGMTYDEQGRIRLGSDPVQAQRTREVLERVVQLIRDPHPDDPLITPTPQPDLLDRIWMATTTPDTIALAARLGLHLFVGQARDAEASAAFVRQYRQAGGAGEARGVRFVLVADTDGEALDAARDGAMAFYAEISLGFTRPGFTRDADIGSVLRQLSFAVGAPATVTDQLRRFAEQSGVGTVDALMHLPGVPRHAVHRSMELFATEVAPMLSAQVTTLTPAPGACRG